jgi:hypothetical protein
MSKPTIAKSKQRNGNKSKPNHPKSSHPRPTVSTNGMEKLATMLRSSASTTPNTFVQTNQIQPRAQRSVTISDREYLLGLTAQNGSDLYSTALINAGNTLFAALSVKAALYEKYVFDKLIFHYKRRVTEYSTSGQAGDATMMFDYDCTDSPPDNLAEVLGTAPHVEFMACENARLVVDCSQWAYKEYYVNTGVISGLQDPKTVNCGQLFAQLWAIPGTQLCGNVECEYTVRLINPTVSGNENALLAPRNFNTSTFTVLTQSIAQGGSGTVLNLLAPAPNNKNSINNTGFTVANGLFSPTVSGNYLVTFNGYVHNAGAVLTTGSVFGYKNGVSNGQTGDNTTDVSFFAGSSTGGVWGMLYIPLTIIRVYALIPADTLSILVICATADASNGIITGELNIISI